MASNGKSQRSASTKKKYSWVCSECGHIIPSQPSEQVCPQCWHRPLVMMIRPAVSIEQEFFSHQPSFVAPSPTDLATHRKRTKRTSRRLGAVLSWQVAGAVLAASVAALMAVGRML